ncbi:MAG TPA: hypothetical protein DEP20_00240 [Fusobacteria bacterium]|nr:hypothetical protein [Fusobacteriota bacterium]|tara:strand:+ start:3415 stop:3645 length:231 start_codon:yes stop_codon:yes gene_type:complete
MKKKNSKLNRVSGGESKAGKSKSSGGSFFSGALSMVKENGGDALKVLTGGDKDKTKEKRIEYIDPFNRPNKMKLFD